MKENERKFFIGIDLGWKEKKTTGLCILEVNETSSHLTSRLASRDSTNEKPVLLKDVFGKDVLKTISPYLKDTKVISIDAPLTQGRGKGKMRLYEKFLSTSIFRKEKVSPLPPALMPQFHKFAMELTKKLEEKGFVLGINLIEVFPTLIKKICQEKFCQKNPSAKTENQKSALICVQIAFLHSQFKTRWLGYKDGFLFLPEMLFWKGEWKEKFYQAWKTRPRLKYYRLSTNLFS